MSVLWSMMVGFRACNAIRLSDLEQEIGKETLDLTIVSLKGGVGNSQTFNSNPCIISNHIQAQIET